MGLRFDLRGANWVARLIYPDVSLPPMILNKQRAITNDGSP